MDISKGKRPFQNKYVQGCRGSNLLFRASLCWKPGAARPAPHVVSVLPEKQLGACVRLIRTRSHVLSRGTEADTRRCARGLGWTCPIPHVRRALRGSPTLRSGQGLALSDLPALRSSACSSVTATSQQQGPLLACDMSRPCPYSRAVVLKVEPQGIPGDRTLSVKDQHALRSWFSQGTGDDPDRTCPQGAHPCPWTRGTCTRGYSPGSERPFGALSGVKSIKASHTRV